MSVLPPERIIDFHELKKLVPYSRQHLRRLEQAGSFPKRINIGPRRVGWILSEIQDWIDIKADRPGRHRKNQCNASQSDGCGESKQHQNTRNNKSGTARFGYEWQNAELIAHSEEAPVLRLAFELFREHKRKKSVARILNELGYRTRRDACFTDTTVARLLRENIADSSYNEADPVVSVELRKACCAILDEQNRTGRTARNVVHLFSGLAYCECGTKMYVPSKTKKYVCTSCRNKIPADDLEALFLEQLKSISLVNHDDSEPHDLSTDWNHLCFAEKRTVVELAVEKMLIGEKSIEINLLV